MTPSPADEPIRQAVTVPVPTDQAFATFADLARWWPHEYTWAANTLEDIGIEPHEGGHCYERGPNGFTCHWGTVLTWEPPTRLVFAWQISADRVPEPDPAKASEVEVRFDPNGTDGTRVALEHRAFARHGDGGDGYRQGMAFPAGLAPDPRPLRQHPALISSPQPASVAERQTRRV